MAANSTNVTRFPGGVAQFTFFGVGAAAGDVTIPGLLTTDKIMYVQAMRITAGATVSSAADMTADFTISAANTANNTGKTTTTSCLVAMTVARTVG